MFLKFEVLSADEGKVYISLHSAAGVGIAIYINIYIYIYIYMQIKLSEQKQQTAIKQPLFISNAYCTQLFRFER